jgi:hypothetical protein
MKKSAQPFLANVHTLLKIPTSKRYTTWVVPEYPFDAQLLAQSSLYLRSRKLYISLGGRFSPRVCSTMRSLSAHDLFADEIDYSPVFSEILWLKEHLQEVVDPEALIKALSGFSEISLFHEQNHRIVWRLLPPAPTDREDFCRYLNFAESMVVTLDLALADQLGRQRSTSFEKMKSIYRTGGEDGWFRRSKKEYRQYLKALLAATYFVLELREPKDIPKGLDYIFPDHKKMVRDAVKRGLDINPLFTLNTNPLWQQKHWRQARAKLTDLHSDSDQPPLFLPEDPVDLEEELIVADDVFDQYGL